MPVVKPERYQKLYDYLIAPSDASENSKAVADLVLTGEDDQEAINELLIGKENLNIGIFYGNVIQSDSINVPYYCNFKGLDPINYPYFYIQDDVADNKVFSMINPMVDPEYGGKALLLSDMALAAINMDWNKQWAGIDPLNIDYTSVGDPLTLLSNMNFFGNKYGIKQIGGNLFASDIYIYNKGKSTGVNGIDITNTSLVTLHADYTYNNRIDSADIGLKINSGCTTVRLEGIRFGNLNTPITGTPTSPLQLIDCWGNFKFENIGTATIAQAATSVTVTHGLAMTPTINQITITPAASCTWWITNITTTQFTINIAAAAPAGGITFGWKCKL